MLSLIATFVFTLSPLGHYQAELNHYISDYLSAIELTRSYPQRVDEALELRDIALKYCEQYNVDPLLASVIMRYEGSWRKGRVGTRGEVGPMQVMPKYFKQFDLTTLDGQIHAGVSHLRASLDACGGDVAQALSYYAANICGRGKRKVPLSKARWRAKQYYKAVQRYRGKGSKNVHDRSKGKRNRF
jgi:hypothetical protein